MPFADSSFHSSVSQPKLHVYISFALAEIAAAQAVAAEMRRVIAAQGRASVIFASSLSATFLAELVRSESVEWTRVIAFHTDEVIRLREDAPQSARRFLLEHLIGRVPIAEFHGLRGEAANPRAVCENYAAMLASRPPDLAALTLGRDGRLGLIDPFDLGEVAKVKIAEREDDGQRVLSLTTGAFADCAALFVVAQSQLHAHRLIEAQPNNLFTSHAQTQFFSVIACPEQKQAMDQGG